jgi:hypothetical protein
MSAAAASAQHTPIAQAARTLISTPARQRASPLERPTEAVAQEDRFVRLRVRQAGHHRRDLGDLPAYVPVGPGDVVAFDVHDQIERLDEDPSDDALSHVLPCHQRCVHECVHRIARTVRVERAQEPTARVDRTRQLERLSAPHLTYDDPIRSHREHELHEIAQTDLTRAVEPRGPDLVVAAVQYGHCEFTYLLAAPHAVGSRNGREQRRRQRGLAGAGFTRDRDPAAKLHRCREEVRGLRAQGVSSHERGEGHVTDRVTPDRRREPIGNGRDRGRQPGSAVEYAGLHEGMFRVELTFRRGEEAIHDLAVLLFRRRLGKAAQTTVGVEICDPRTLDEHFLDVASREKLAQWSELRDGTQHPLRHLRRVTKRHLVAQPSATLIIIDCALDLDPHLADLGDGLQPPPLDAGDRVASNDVVRVGARCHDAASNPTAPSERRGSAMTRRAISSTARVNGPRPTAVPFHAASPTRPSAGTNTTSTSGRLVLISS